MKYTVEVGMWGAECVAGKIPDKIWKYIQDECDGDANEYADKLNEGEVPEELKLAEDVGSFYDTEGFFYQSLPYADTGITITDENGNVVLDCDLTDLKQNIVDETTEPEGCKHCFVWRSVEKSSGWISGVFETDEPFDKSKLVVNVYRLNLYNEDWCMDFASSIEYGDESIEACVEESRGISYELEFIDDGLPD